MKISNRSIYDLARMVCGGVGSVTLGAQESEWQDFVYRSSSELSRFFLYCDTDYKHDGSTRAQWVEGVLTQLNEGAASNPALPADKIVRVIQELMNPAEFKKTGREIEPALTKLNELLGREGLEAYLDGADRCHVRAGSVTSASVAAIDRPWSEKDLKRRKEWSVYLDDASEDDFTGEVLLPLLLRCGFQRVSVAGHADKALEFGKDIWMRLRLPTGHFIYFGVQVKKGKIDSAGRTRGDNQNITEVVNQVRMALASPILDPDVNTSVQIDHVYVVATGDITKAAKSLLATMLDKESRRQMIFMDREDILKLAVQTGLAVPSPTADEINF